MRGYRALLVGAGGMGRAWGQNLAASARVELAGWVAIRRALDTGATPMGECHDNIKSLAIVFAASESAESGRRLPVVI